MKPRAGRVIPAHKTMNKEEAYNLEKGQEVFVRAIFTNIHEDIEIRCDAKEANGNNWVVYSDLKHVFTALPTANENATENKPKHDPCRLFKKGDRVRIKREINGRKLNHVFVNFSYDQTYTVAQDEEQKEYQSGLVKIINETGHTFTGSFYELELVTPVEEIPTYRVGDFATNGEICVWRDQGGKTEKVCSFNVNTHPNAKAAAEAERDRLNEEWRKEQNNG